MATLSYLPTFYSLSCRELLSSPNPHPSFHYNYSRPTICLSLTKKPRATRKAKSNVDIRNDIKEFLYTVGLPEDHVPSTKEFSEHGRQDLANIVRRRGYKFIRELLTAPTETEIGVASTEECLTENQEVHGDRKDISAGQNDEVKDLADDFSLSSEVTEVKEPTEDFAEDVSLSCKAPKVEVDTTDLVEDVSLLNQATISENSRTNSDISRKELTLEEPGCSGPESSDYPSLEEKVAKFIQDGQLDDLEDSGFEILNCKASEDSMGIVKPQDVIELKSGSLNGKHEDLVVCGAGGSDILNGHITSSYQQVECPAWETNASRTETLSTEEESIVDQNEDLDDEVKCTIILTQFSFFTCFDAMEFCFLQHAQEADNQAEISRLKFMLHQKELELTILKEQIEKEKLALTMLQTRAENEISKTQKLISKKDAELQAAEENLSGLKEVEIEYWGEGEIVEVAGSFNGWHHIIKMDLHSSTSISDLTGSRKSRVWRTVLWLYPGVYEIKFIADGHWTIDPQREFVTRGFIQNNILRVDR